MMTVFAARCEVVVKGLNQILGFRCINSRRAFYAISNIEGTGAEFAAYLLENAGIALLNGGSFGPYGEGDLRSALERIEAAIQAR